ncbi:MAG: alanine racemase [Candidatus Cryosericum sp.]
MNSFPRVVVDLDCLTDNAVKVRSLCQEHRLSVVAVTKGVTSDAEIVQAFMRGGIHSIGDSRVHDFLSLRQEEFGVLELTLLRQAPRSQMHLVPHITDRAFMSELTAMKALGEAALAKGTVCDVLVVVEMGDRRDGVPLSDLTSFIDAASQIDGVEITGLAANLGCITGILPTIENQERFGSVAARVRRETGLALPIISTGGTVALDLIERGVLSPIITELRTGEALLLGVSTTDSRVIPWLRQDAFVLEAEVIEVRDKPSAPDGPVGLDAEGRRPQIVDHGIRRRAVVALGYTDTEPAALVPLDAGVTIVGSSSDHMVLDVTDAEREFTEGDVVAFRMRYAALLHSMLSPYVARGYARTVDAAVETLTRAGRLTEGRQTCPDDRTGT